MDIDFDDLISTDAAINAKASKKFQPKAKPKPKPKPKTPPEPKSVPAPSNQFVEAAATANNEPIGRTDEEQIGNDVNHISGDIHDDGQSSYKKSQEENAKSCLASELLNDLLPESTAAPVNASSHSETPTFHVSVDGNLERGLLEPDLINDIHSCTNLESLGQVDPLTGEEATIYNDTGDFLIGNLSSGLKDVESSPLWGSLDILSESKTRSGPKVGKFKPKPKAQTRRVEHIANTPDQHAVENICTVSSQINFTYNKSIPSSKPDEILGSSTTVVRDSVPTETISHFHVNEDPTHLAEISQVDSVNQAGRFSERLKKKSNKALELVDEPEDEGTNDDFVNGNEDNNKDGDCGPEIETFSEKKGGKSNKPVSEKVKTVRKRKKASGVPGDSNNVAKKKFSHSTKRSRRQVNPEMLKIPEDELEMHMLNFPMRDIIRFAEHRERIAKKDASTSAMDPRSSRLSNHNDKDEEISQGGSSHDNVMGPDNTTYYNYRTYTKITPRMKWSKQDTELFYEAVQQFGSDLSMIKECFPGRTREQIKSKYKKEERQQPSRLNDALTTRATGHSHFEVVIERLKQAQAEDSENDDQSNLIGEDDEEGLPSHDIKKLIFLSLSRTSFVPITKNMLILQESADTTKPVQLGKESKDDIPAAAAASPTKSHDTEDDMFRWSQYKSEI